MSFTAYAYMELCVGFENSKRSTRCRPRTFPSSSDLLSLDLHQRPCLVTMHRWEAVEVEGRRCKT